MKRLLFVLVILLSTLGVHSQQYKVKVSGYIGSGPSGCGTNNNGLKWIRLYFSDGSDEYLFRQDSGQFRNQSYSFTSTTNYNLNKRLLRVGFKTVSRERRTLGDCSSSKTREAFVNVSSPCYNQNFPKEDIYERRINRGNAVVSVIPVMDLTFKDGSSITNVYSGCEGEAIDIDASAGFTPNTNIYVWEFNDPVNTATQNHPAYQALLNAVSAAQGAYSNCIRQSGDPDRCESQFIALINARQALNTYTGPETIQVPVWRPITTKIGQSNISLALSDLYTNSVDQKTGVNKNIDIRISPSCNSFDARTNMLTIQYLPKPPEIPRDPDIADLECSYSTTAGFTMFFDRQINDFEEVDISLLRKLDNGPTYVAFDNNTNITSFAPLDAITWTHTWNPTSGKEIKAGEYEIQVTGYERGGSSAIPFCEIYKYFFTVTAPEPVAYNAIKNQDETCFDKDDGSIEITASGGSESYKYEIRKGAAIARSGTFTLAQSPFQVKDLAPGTYMVNVTDSKNCEDRVNVQAPIEIKEIDQIIHKVANNGITLPSATGSSDGRIVIESVSGGTKFSGTGYDYKYEILLNGSTTNTLSGESFSGGYDIINLPAGTHTIRYEDTNKCTIDILLPEIAEPISITKVETTPIKCFGGKATVTITATGGYSGIYDYALWTGLPLQPSDWQASNVFSLDANTTSGYRFVARDRNNINYVSQASDAELINQPSRIRIIRTEVKHNNVFADNKGEITLTISGGTPRVTSPDYIVAWKKDGTEDIPNAGASISGLLAGDYVATIKDDKDCTIVSGIIKVTEPDELLVSIKETTPIPCYNGTGTLTAQPTGGSLNYSFQWFKNGIKLDGETSIVLSNVKAGNYTVEVNDLYITKQAAKDFREPDQLSLSLSEVNVTCFNGNDGKIILNPEGGIAPYSYSIDNKVTYIPVDDLTNLTIDGLIAGSYNVWLKDKNDCEIPVAETKTITAPSEIMIEETSLEHVTVIGGIDGSISIDVTGGTGDKTYSWTKLGDENFTRITKDISNLSFGSYTVLIKDEKGCENDKTFEVKQPLPIQVVIEEVIPILCHEDESGELLATVTGGYPLDATPSDYEYRWYRIENTIETPINTDITLDRLENLPAGTYKVVVNDSKGASTDETFNLLEPDDLLVSLAAGMPVDVKCFGEATGAIDITVVGGPKNESTGEYLPYTFSWTKVEDPSFKATTEDLQNISAGTYEVVVVDDNLCTTSLSEAVVINQPDAVLEIYDVESVNLTGFQTQDGSVSLEVRGGTAPYTYSWTDLDDSNYAATSQDIKDLPIGNYNVVVTDANDCTTSITRLITEPNQLIVSITPLAENEGVQCFGGQTVLSLSTTTQGGVGSYTYEWYEENDVTTILFTTSETTKVNAGTYVVVVTDENGNRDDDTYEVTQPNMLDISENITHLLCRGDDDGRIDITVSGGVAPYMYNWRNGETTEDLSSLRAGNYTITVTDANKCKVEKEIEVEQPRGLFVNGDISRIYPSSNGATDGSVTVNIGGGTPPYAYEWRDFNDVLQTSTTNVLDAIGAEKYSLTVIDDNDCTLVIEDVDIFEPPILEVSVDQVNVVTCNGVSSASLRAIVEGGVPYNAAKQYNYQWFDANNTAIGEDRFLIEDIGAGNYYVIVSDAVNTSITSKVFNLGEPDILESKMSTDFVNCGDRNDWTIIPQVTGGTAPYTFLWNTGDTGNVLENVSAGSYSVTITDVRGCFVTDRVTVTSPEALVTREKLTIPTCFKGCDGTIVIETEGGTPPYSYEWSNGTTKKDLINICADTYTVTITDAKGCQISKEIVLNNPQELILDLGEDITLCKDQIATLNATIEDPNATYLWTSTNGFSSTNPVVEVSDSNIYEVLVTDSKGCEARGDIFVDTVLDPISAHFIASSQVFTGEEFVIVDNSDPVPESIDWMFPEEATVTYEDEHYAELIFDEPGEYEVTLQTNIGLCNATLTKTIIVLDKEIEDEQEEAETTTDIQTLFEYKVYPNPTFDGQFTVDVNLKKVQPISLKIFNIIDNKLLDSRIGKDKDTYTFEYDLSLLPSGVYFILLETSSASQVRKLVIE